LFRLQIEAKLDRQQLAAREALILALRRETPWPERSGRKFDRFQMRIPVSYLVSGLVRHEFTRNISLTGMFVESTNAPPVGSRFHFSLGDGEYTGSANIEGQVVHHRIDGSSLEVASPTSFGFGVRFARPSLDALKRLGQVFDSRLIGATKHMLLIDDDPFFRTVLSNAFRLEGCRVSTAENTTTALEVFLEEFPRIRTIVVDWYLQNQSGKDIIQAIRKICRNTKLQFIIVSASTLPYETLALLQHLHVSEVFSKSVSPSEIVNVALSRY
jgi:CheY-like chemotaxis protein